MKAFKKYILIVIVAIYSFGCGEEFVDLNPKSSIVSTSFYQTEEELFEALVAVYDVLGNQSQSGWAPAQFISDILSDDSFAGGGDAADGTEQDQLNTFVIPTTNDKAYSIWARNYVGIYRANLYLSEVGGIETEGNFASRTSAEAKFLRAYYYFELLRFFENVPLLVRIISGPSEFIQTQNPVDEVYNQVALDLVEAIVDLPTEIPAEENGRISKWAAEALLARVYLFYNDVYGLELIAGETTVDRSTALAYLEDLISNSNHDLLASYDDIFRLSSEFSVESVFEISHGDAPVWWDWGYPQGGEGNLAAQLQGPRVTGSAGWDRGWSFATVSNKLATDLSGDPRYDATILDEGEIDGNLIYGYQHTGFYSQKYSSDAEHYGSGGQFELNRTCNYRVIRYADVLLMAAELGSSNAQSYLDAVRARVGLGSVPVSMDNIMQERRLELALEGHRYFDVIRKGMDYADQELTVQEDRGSLYQDRQEVYNTTFNRATKGFLPIPQQEIDLSAGAFIQNDGY